MRGSCRFELVEMLRKLVLIAVLAAIAEESTMYLNIAEVVSIGALYIFAYCKPFAEAEVNRLQTITLLVTSLTIFYGIMLNAPQGNVDSGDSNERTAKARPSRMRCVVAGSALRNLQGTLLAIMNVAVLVLPLVQLWVSTHRLLNALRIKALALIRSKLGCARPAADALPEAEGDVQVSSRCLASLLEAIHRVAPGLGSLNGRPYPTARLSCPSATVAHTLSSGRGSTG